MALKTALYVQIMAKITAKIVQIMLLYACKRRTFHGKISPAKVA